MHPVAATGPEPNSAGPVSASRPSCRTDRSSSGCLKVLPRRCPLLPGQPPVEREGERRAVRRLQAPQLPGSHARTPQRALVHACLPGDCVRRLSKPLVDARSLAVHQCQHTSTFLSCSGVVGQAQSSSGERSARQKLHCWRRLPCMSAPPSRASALRTTPEELPSPPRLRDLMPGGHSSDAVMRSAKGRTLVLLS